MNYDVILIRYGELALKSPYVRKQFEMRLTRNIIQAFEENKIPCTTRREWGRIYVFTEEITKSIDILMRIFGITSISPAVQTIAEMQSMMTCAVSIAKQTIKKKDRFALRVTRTGTHPFTSQDVAVRLGDEIRKTTDARVDLTHPTVEIGIDIRNKNAFLFLERIPGSGGLPLGTQGEIIVFMENMRSLLAGWYLMRRGCSPVIVITEDTQKEMIASFLREWHVPSDIVRISKSEHLYDDINTIAVERKCDAVVSGLTFTDASAGLLTRLKTKIHVPVMYPLIAMDDETIHQKCMEVGIPL